MVDTQRPKELKEIKNSFKNPKKGNFIPEIVKTDSSKEGATTKTTQNGAPFLNKPALFQNTFSQKQTKKN